ncbi:MAG: hypothetical protein AAGB93_06240 [Planctomycetota bacterium]
MFSRALLPTLAIVGVSSASASDTLLAAASAHDELRTGTLDGQLWARGATYKAIADADGFTYVPYLGADASRSWPITFRLARASSAFADLPLDVATCSFDRDAAQIDRGAVRARYLLANDSVEQTFVLDRAVLGAGDAVLEVQVSTELTVTRTGSGLVFSGPDGEVHFGSATAFDGAGRTRALATEWDGASLTYRVPASFVAESTGDIVVDPLITTVTVDDFDLELTKPDVAYDADTDTFCVIYEEQFSATDGDVYARTLDGTTLALQDGGYLEIGTRRAFGPRVATIAASNRFVAVYTEEDAFDRPSILSRSRLADSGAPWEAERQIAVTDEFFTYENPDIGGEAYELMGPSSAAVVFERNPRGSVPLPSGIRAALVDLDGVPFDWFDIAPALGAVSLTKPTISKYTGDPLVHGAWWVAYLAGPADGPARRVHTTRMRFDGVLSEVDQVAWQTTNVAELERVDVSSPYASIEGEAFHMSIEGSLNGSDELLIWNRCFETNGTLQPVFQTNIQEIFTSAELRRGSLATTTDRVLHSYFDRATSGSTFELRSTTHENVPGNASAIGERRITLGQLNETDPSAAAAASRASGGTGSTSNEVFVVWQDREVGGDADIHGALVDLSFPNAVGGTLCPGTRNSTGEFGFLAGFGDDGLTTPKTMIATNLPLSALGYFLASRTISPSSPGGSSGLLCLGGSIGRYAGSILDSGTGGRFVFTIDPTSIASPTGSVSAMAGERWYFQAWHRDANPVPTSNFTNVVTIRF